MPVAGGSGGGTGKTGGKKPPKQPIVVYNPATGTTTTVQPVGGSSSTSTSGAAAGAKGGGRAGGTAGSSGGTSSSSSSSSSSSGSNDYLKAQQKARDAAAERYMVDAANLQGQIDALRKVLGPKGRYRDALDKRLANIDLVTGQQITMLDNVAKARDESLDADMANNRAAAGDSSGTNDINRSRERTMALAEVAAQGAGESDSLRAQLMSLRSWDANQEGINRAFHDSQRSIQAARIDLQADTATAKANALSEANADRGQLWNEYYAQSAESFTQLGNTLGQQAEYYGMAKEQGANLGKGSKSRSSSSSSSSSSTKGGKAAGTRWGVRGPGADDSWSDAGPADGTGLGPWDGPSGARRTEAPSGGMGSATGGGTGKGGRGGPLGGRNGDDGRAGKNKKRGNLQQRAADKSDRAFMQAANWMGRAWKDPGIGDAVDWAPELAPTEQLNNSLLSNARTAIVQQRPEGATLRKW